jgi:hypothetical protein
MSFEENSMRVRYAEMKLCLVLGEVQVRDFQDEDVV